MAIWIVIGASRGIGLEWVKQILARGNTVFATVRDHTKASQLWTLSGSAPRMSCQLLECDVSSEDSITRFANDIAAMRNLDRIDHVIVNAGILNYPNRATELSFENFSNHLRTNAVGPIITAQKLLQTRIPIGTITFMSSDSGCATDFRAFEDGFAAYAASKAALNQMLRHMAAELQRTKVYTTILAMHPGEVATDMLNISVGWEVDGIISAEQSVAAMLPVVESKTIKDSGTFWTWEGLSFAKKSFLGLPNEAPGVSVNSPSCQRPFDGFVITQTEASLRHQDEELHPKIPLTEGKLPTCKHASTAAPIPKVIRLEKPAKFNPPSHGKRLKQQIPRHYGPQLTQEQKVEQNTKQYPKMMPPPGSFMFWFLTSRGIHAFISLGTLVLLASFTAYENWKRATAFREQLPEANAFLWHPIRSVFKVLDIWALDVNRTTNETQERRMRDISDVQKRATYRRAHGLEDEGSQGLGGWTAKSDEENLGASPRVDGAVGRPIFRTASLPVGEDGMPSDGGSREAVYVDWEGRKRPVKKWLGIW